MPYSSIIKEITENIAKGELEEALSKINIIEGVAEHNETLLHALYYKSKIDLINSNFNIALDRAEKCVNLARNLNLYPFVAKSLALLAFTLMSLGRLDEAFDQLTQAEHILNDYESDLERDERSLNNIFGNIYNTKAMIYWKNGELYEALDWHEKALSYRKKLPKKLEVAISMSNIGTVYRDLYQYDKALEYYQKAYAIKKTLQNRRSKSRILFYIIHSALISGKSEIVDHYFNSIEQFANDPNEFIRLNYKMSKALILKNHKRLRQKMQAETLFHDIVHSDMINPQLTLLAMKHLCEIYLDEYNLYGEEEVLQTVKDLVNRIKRISENIGLFSSLIVAHVLQSKLHLISGQLDKAVEFLDEAERISSQKNLIKLVEEVRNEKDNLERTYTDWKNKVYSSENIQQRMEKVEIKKYIAYVQQMTGLKFNE